MVSMLSLGEKRVAVLGICKREEITASFCYCMDRLGCVHPFTKVLQAMHFAKMFVYHKQDTSISVWLLQLEY